MNARRMALFLTAVVVLTTSVAIAQQVPVPGVSNGGELAYVRDHPVGALQAADAGERVTATYVAWSLEARPGADLLVGYTSRGRVADTELWRHVVFPAGALQAPAFAPVAQFERALVVAASESGCVALLNGVNAGMGFVARAPVELRFGTTGHFAVEALDDQRVELRRDGHVVALQAFGDASLRVSGVNVAAALEPGGEVRSWIDGGAFPATTTYMHMEFDALRAGCLA